MNTKKDGYLAGNKATDSYWTFYYLSDFYKVKPI